MTWLHRPAIPPPKKDRSVVRDLRQTWSGSRAFRIFLIASLLYLVLRFAAQGVFLYYLISSGETEGHDLDIYLDAASQLQQRQALYPQGAIEEIEFYQYSPAYALAFVPLAKLSFALSAIILSILHVAAYILLYLCWRRIFRRLGLEAADRAMIWTLPLWFVFTAFWGDLIYINVYIFMALLATLSIDAVLDERVGLAALWLSLILQVKPQWAFVMVLPLLLGRYRFCFRLLALTVIGYGVIIGLVATQVGWSYGLQQYTDYGKLLLSLLGGNYAWKEPGFAFLGYNHSITQILAYLFGATPAVMRASLLVRIVLLLPLAAIAWRHLRHPSRCPGREVPQLSLDLVFGFYLAAFVWLNVVWELTLSIVVFVYLVATLHDRRVKAVLWTIFLLYALLDAWRLFSYALVGPSVLMGNAFVWTDPALYVPVVMLLILALYFVMIGRLWAVPQLRGARGKV